MKLNKTIKTLKELGAKVVKQGKSNLANSKPYSKKTKKNTLYNDFSYNVSNTDESISLEWNFGGAEDYWEFVDQGVRGSGKSKGGTTKSGKKAKRGGTGTIRAKNSPFAYTNKMPPRGVIDKWIVGKPLMSARDKKGRFITRKTMAYLIQRSIFQKGLYRTLFFTKPYKQETKKYEPLIEESFAEDLMNDLQNNFNTQ